MPTPYGFLALEDFVLCVAPFYDHTWVKVIPVSTFLVYVGILYVGWYLLPTWAAVIKSGFL